jgi:hypothetical protein
MDPPSVAERSLLFGACMRMLPFGISGTDADGDPVAVVCPGRLGMKSLRAAGCTHAVFDDFVACMIVFMYEHHLPRAFPGRERISVVIDAAGVSAEHIAIAKYVATRAGAMHHSRYPGRQKRIFVVNASIAFRAAWAVLKHALLAREVHERVHISAKMPDLPARALPVFLGGEQPDACIFKPKDWEQSFAEFARKRAGA